MSVPLSQLVIVFILLSATASGQQKEIVVNDSLLANSDKLNVKVGLQWPGKIHRFSFSGYTIVSSKAERTKTSQKGNLTSSNTESKGKFSFVMVNTSGDSVNVNAMQTIATKAKNSIPISPNFSVGTDELMEHSTSFFALITLMTDTTEKWTLHLDSTIDSSVTKKREEFLTNGTRIINLVFTSSDKNKPNRWRISALGYEFFENDRSVAALQYYGGGSGTSELKNIIWIARDLDSKMKVILASAMVAVLQVKLNSNVEMAYPIEL